MTPKDAMIYQIKQLNGKPLKYKIDYVLTYFHRAIIGFIIVVICLTSLIFHMIVKKESALDVVCINSLYADTEQISNYSSLLTSRLDIDTDNYEVRFFSDFYISDNNSLDSYETTTRLFTMIAGEEVDIMAGDSNAILRFAYSDCCKDLSSLLTQEELKEYEDYFLYIDMSLIENRDAYLIADGLLCPQS